MTLRGLLVTLSVSTLFLAGCKPDAALKKGEVIGRGSEPVSAPTPSVDAARIEGVIHFAGKAPARPKIDMSMDPACSMSASENSAESVVTDSGKLANVFIYIKLGAPSADANPGTPPVVMDQKGCRYTPHVIAVQRGAAVEFRNSDPTMHNIHTAPQTPGYMPVDISQGPGSRPQINTFGNPQVMLPVRCNNHPWMLGYINVADNPYFAVSAADGSFVINGLPPGAYTLAAVHEKLGEQDIQITVAPRAKLKADFTFGK